ncbi:MAG: hypothetical protein R3F29_09160 [Planctomycetota bacterium]
MADDPAWLCTVDSAEALFATPFAGRRDRARCRRLRPRDQAAARSQQLSAKATATMLGIGVEAANSATSVRSRG